MLTSTFFKLQAEQEDTIECIADSLATLRTLASRSATSSAPGNTLMNGNNSHAHVNENVTSSVRMQSACGDGTFHLLEKELLDMQGLVKHLRKLHSRTISSYTGIGGLKLLSCLCSVFHDRICMSLAEMHREAMYSQQLHNESERQLQRAR